MGSHWETVVLSFCAVDSREMLTTVTVSLYMPTSGDTMPSKRLERDLCQKLLLDKRLCSVAVRVDC
jgi:hypothetical protein